MPSKTQIADRRPTAQPYSAHPTIADLVAWQAIGWPFTTLVLTILLFWVGIPIGPYHLWAALLLFLVLGGRLADDRRAWLIASLWLAGSTLLGGSFGMALWFQRRRSVASPPRHPGFSAGMGSSSRPSTGRLESRVRADHQHCGYLRSALCKRRLDYLRRGLQRNRAARSHEGVQPALHAGSLSVNRNPVSCAIKHFGNLRPRSTVYNPATGCNGGRDEFEVIDWPRIFSVTPSPLAKPSTKPSTTRITAISC